MLKPLHLGVFALLIQCVICSTARVDEASASNTTEPGTSWTSTTESPTRTPSTTPSIDTATCLSRTINYITHTLPQQCLRTDRASANLNKTVVEELGSSTTISYSFSATDSEAISNLHSSTSATSETSDADWSEKTIAPTQGVGEPSGSAAAATEQASSESAVAGEDESDPESPLDNANFLSFEEWRRLNLVKAGQSSEQGQNIPVVGDRQRPINNALDSLGDEGEIEIDFSGFGGDGSSGTTGPRQHQAAYRAPDEAEVEQNAPSTYTARSKDAGKTCKERTNYASFDCAATILKNNPECKSASSVLVENKDSYMLNTCSANNKFFIVELCNDILIDTVVLANYEFFSSIFRHFRISVSDRYPVRADKWRDLGTFEAKNTRDVQAFLVEHPQIWARYLRVEFLTHYGSEYYCPLSLLRVHGTTMLEDLRPQEEQLPNDGTGETVLDAEWSKPIPTPEDSTESHPESRTVTESSSSGETAAAEGKAPTSTETTTPTLVGDESGAAVESEVALENSTTSNSTDLIIPMEVLGLKGMCNLSGTYSRTAASGDTEKTTATVTSQETNTQQFLNSTGATWAGVIPTSAPESVTEISMTTSSSEAIHSTNDNATSTEKQSSEDYTAASINGSTAASFNPSSSSVNAYTVETASSTNETVATVMSSPTNSTRTATSTSASAQAQPTTQESFFKSIHKRLQQLESNSTLSLQYIEEQSRILRDAFSKVEKRQISATTSFLANLNETVMAELREFRQAYDQLWQSTVIELDGQREQYQREMLALSTRLTLVADELVWQKRMGIVQSTLLLLCLALVLFARSGNGYLEVPIMQQVMKRSQSALALQTHGWESPPASPSPDSRSPVSLFRRKLWRSVTEAGGSGNFTDGTDSRPDSRPESKDGPPPDVLVEPPTPEGITPPSENDRSVDEALGEDDLEPMVDLRGSQSEPATPIKTPEMPLLPPDPFVLDSDGV